MIEAIRRSNHALVLPGGGAKCSVQAGAYKGMRKAGIKPTKVFGTSGGGLNASLIAQGKEALMYKMWDDVGRSSGSLISAAYLAEFHEGTLRPNVDAIMDILTHGINFWDKVGLVRKEGRTKFVKKIIENGKSIDKVMDNSPLKDILVKNVKKDHFEMEFGFTLVSLYDGSLYTLNQNSFIDDYNLALGVLASSSMPGVWAPIPEIVLADGSVIRDAVDGGLRSSSPLPQAMSSLTFDDDWFVWAINPNTIQQMINSSKKNIIVQAASCIDIMLNEGLQRDIKMTEKINKWALDDPAWAIRNNVKYATIFNIEAPVDLNGNPLLGKTLDFRKEAIDKRIAIGEQSVLNYIKLVA